MRLSKATWLVLGIGIIIVIVASLAFNYAQQGQEQSQLNQDLSLAKLRLEKYLSEPPPSEKEELESQLAQARSQLEATKASLSQPIESIEETDTLFDIAEDCNVEIFEINSSFLTSETLENVTYSALPLNVIARGDVPNLINFVLKWTEQYPTGAVDSVEITAPKTIDEVEEAEEEGAEEEGAEEEQAEEVEPVKPSAELSLSIYTYEGD